MLSLSLQEKLLGVVHRFNGGLLHKALHDPPREDHRRALVRLMSRALGITEVSGDQSTDQQGVREVEVSSPSSADTESDSAMTLCGPQGLLLTGSMLELLTCGERGDAELRKILLLPEEQQPVLLAYRSSVCRGGPAERSERFRQLSQELREQIDTQSITEKVRLRSRSDAALKAVFIPFRKAGSKVFNPFSFLLNFTFNHLKLCQQCCVWTDSEVDMFCLFFLLRLFILVTVDLLLNWS